MTVSYMTGKSDHSAATAPLALKLLKMDIFLNPIFHALAQLTSSHPFCLTTQNLSTSRTLESNWTALSELHKSKNE